MKTNCTSSVVDWPTPGRERKIWPRTQALCRAYYHEDQTVAFAERRCFGTWSEKMFISSDMRRILGEETFTKLWRWWKFTSGRKKRSDWMSFWAANLLRVDNVELQRSQNGAKQSTKPITPDRNTQEFIKGKSSLVLYQWREGKI